MNYFFICFFLIHFKFPKAILNFSKKHCLYLCCTHNTLNYSLKKNCSKISFFPDDIISTSSYKLKYIFQYLATDWEKKYFSLFLRSLMSSPGGGGGGGTLNFFYMRKLGLLFWVQNFEFQYFWGFSKKKKIDIFGV